MDTPSGSKPSSDSAQGEKEVAHLNHLQDPIVAVLSTHADEQNAPDGIDDGEVFARTGDGPDFRAVSWPSAAVLITKTQMGIGVLGIPATLDTLGYVPGIITLITLCAITTYAGILAGTFRHRHPSVHNIGDVGYMLFGTAGQEVIGVFYWLFMTMIAAGGLLGSSIAFNAFTEHATCTMVWTFVAAALAWLAGGGFRSLNRVAWLGWFGLACVFTAVWLATIAVIVQDRPAAAPPGPVDLDVRAFKRPSFTAAMTAVSTQLTALSGTPAFFSIGAEMREPRHYRRSLFSAQVFVFVNYVAVGLIVYLECGQYLASPALGSAGPLVKKIAYGIGLPGLLVTAILYTHVAAKYIFVRVLRHTRHLQANTVTHWLVWGASLTVGVAFSFVISGAVPFFDDLLGLVGAFLGSFLTLLIPGLMWFYDAVGKPAHKVEDGDKPSKGRYAWILRALRSARHGKKQAIKVLLNVVLVLLGAFLMVAGTYSSVVSIRDKYNAGTVGSAFSCADNSN